VRKRLPADATLAEVAGLLIGSFVPLRVAVDGRVAGWYRLGPGDGPLPPDTRIGTLPTDLVLHFHPVTGPLYPVLLEVQGNILRLDLASWLPVQSLIDAVASMVDLPAADWSLWAGELRLPPSSLLLDLPSPPDRLAVR